MDMVKGGWREKAVRKEGRKEEDKRERDMSELSE